MFWIQILQVVDAGCGSLIPTHDSSRGLEDEKIGCCGGGANARIDCFFFCVILVVGVGVLDGGENGGGDNGGDVDVGSVDVGVGIDGEEMEWMREINGRVVDGNCRMVCCVGARRERECEGWSQIDFTVDVMESIAFCTMVTTFSSRQTVLYV